MTASQLRALRTSPEQHDVASQRMADTSSTPGEGFLGLGGMRLTRRGRIVVWVVALTAALGTGIFLGGNAFADPVQRPQEILFHAVGTGETLWDIARDHAPQRDPRDVVQEIREVNNMASANLQVGEVLLIPAP